METGKKKDKNIAKRIRRAFPLYLMILPGFVYLLINNYIPMGGIVIAFKDLNFQKGIFGSDWVGFNNFVYLFKTPEAFRILRNTVCYNLAFLVVNTTAALTIAILMSEIRNKRRLKIYQACVLVPTLVSIIIVSYMVYAFLNTRTGYINGMLRAMGKKEIAFYSESVYWPFILVFVNFWKGAGYSSVIYLATILGIDQEMLEAASIDGATRWQKIKCIILPLLKPTVIILTLMSISKIFNSDFGLFYQVPLNSGALIDATNTIDTYVYRGMINLGDIGMTAAAGFYQSTVGFVLILIVNGITRKYSSENALF